MIRKDNLFLTPETCEDVLRYGVQVALVPDEVETVGRYGENGAQIEGRDPFFV